MSTAPSAPLPAAPTAASDRRALVLGGGGSTGNAWLIGVLAGLADAGLDVTGADLVIGTSAGATAAAQITGASTADLFAAALVAPPPRVGHPGRSPVEPVADPLERTGRIIAAAVDAADMLRRMGAAALEVDAASDGSRHDRWRATVAARLPGSSWPDRTVHLTVVDAATGEPVVLDRNSGVDLVDAVAASTAGGPPHRIGDRLYIDGGYRSVDNADLAAGYGRVLVLSPLGGSSRHPKEWGTDLAAHVERLRAGGSRVQTIVPDGAAEQLFGANAMDLSLRPAAARIGHEQGTALAGELAALWR